MILENIYECIFFLACVVYDVMIGGFFLQGGDVGTQYRSGIYFYSMEQEAVARESMEKEEKKLGRKVVTELEPAKKWFNAEKYHQQYLSKGGRMGMGQNATKGCKDPIRCYG